MPAPPGLTVPIAFHFLHIPALMIASSFIVVFSLALASIFPAIRASRLQIAEALAHV
jgi:ABC-type antimicrobial peptide transport system permease subunit